jgi:hypothetical protein
MGSIAAPHTNAAALPARFNGLVPALPLSVVSVSKACSLKPTSDFGRVVFSDSKNALSRAHYADRPEGVVPQTKADSDERFAIDASKILLRKRGTLGAAGTGTGSDVSLSLCPSAQYSWDTFSPCCPCDVPETVCVTHHLRRM